MPGTRLADEFARELRAPIPERLALAVARLAYPTLDPQPYLEQLDGMARIVAARVAQTPSGATRATAFVDAIRTDLGFHGDLIRYYDVENSYLNLVLERRQGLPIMLSLVGMALARRINLRVEGIGFPGHFMTRYEDAAGHWYLDLFHGAVLTADAVEEYLGSVLAQAIQLDAESYTPVSSQALALRILNNLRVAYLGREDAAMAAQVIELMAVLTPDATQLWWELGVLRYRIGDLEGAARALRRYFHLQGHVALTLPAAAGPAAQPDPATGEAGAWQLLQEIEAARRRLN